VGFERWITNQAQFHRDPILLSQLKTYFFSIALSNPGRRTTYATLVLEYRVLLPLLHVFSWSKIIHMFLFSPSFNLNKWFSHQLNILLSFCDFVVSVRRSFVFPSCAGICFSVLCGVCLVQKDRSTLIACWFNKWQAPKRWRFGGIGIPVILNLSHYL
jgi:hypothetical protein